jgi:hypothetical protein
MDLKVLKEIKNKRGELKTKIVRVENKDYKKGLQFNDINELYKELLEKYKAEDITMIAKPFDGNYVTLKTTNHLGDDLKHADENYYSSMPKEIQKRLQGKYLSVDITVQC